MAKLEDLGEVVSTDVLIVGGGIGGLVTAIKAKEESPDVDVLMVDRETIGYAGKAPKGGGVFWVLTPEDDPDKFLEYHVKNIGIYLEDQELCYAYASDTYRGVEELAEWGVKIDKDVDGKPIVTKNPGTGLWGLAGGELDMTARNVPSGILTMGCPSLCTTFCPGGGWTTVGTVSHVFPRSADLTAKHTSSGLESVGPA